MPCFSGSKLKGNRVWELYLAPRKLAPAKHSVSELERAVRYLDKIKEIQKKKIFCLFFENFCFIVGFS